MGPFGIAIRFQLSRMTDESMDCDIPKGVPLIQQLANTLPPPDSLPETAKIQTKGAHWSLTLVHSLWPEHLRMPFNARPVSVLTGENEPPMLRFQLPPEAQWSACFESFLKEWQALDPKHPLLVPMDSQIMAS
jgi:hypothetical protein